MVDASGDDDAFCRASNAAGSPEYVDCRKDRDVQRSQRQLARRQAAAQSRRIHAEQSDAAVTRETIMNEDKFNTSLRGFLKKVGITSQREIEKAVRDAVAAGRLKGNEKLPAKMVLTVGGVSLTHEITEEIELG